MTDIYQARRARAMQALGDGVAVIPAAPERRRTRTTTYPYKPDADFFYLTGFDEPGATLVLHPEGPVLFLRPRDPLRETWDGPRLGVDAAPGALGLAAAFPDAELTQRLPGLLRGAANVHFPLGRYPEHDAWFVPAFSGLGTRQYAAPGAVADPATWLHEARVIKGPEELAAMRAAAAITAAGFAAARAAIAPGVREYEIEALLTGTFRARGATGPAYNTIVAAGAHATCLHHVRNDGTLRSGELVLIDAGAEVGGYACDVSRTYAVDGTPSEAQQAALGWVAKAQHAAIAELRAGNSIERFHEAAVTVLTEGLQALGVALGPDGHQPYYMHHTGHFLGLEVHDVGAFRPDGEWRQLAPGMVLTVEPGLYFPVGDERVPAALRGVGIRLEDDVLVTTGEPEILSAMIPR
ncbi:MAG: peptidase [Cyanobacteria bacterium RYN_339]|nr:peptidase [Cyanobacteria bacterium RYN_339]